MATERNPFNTIPEAVSNIVQLPTQQEEGEPTFELDPDGGVTVDFTQTTIEMEAEEDIQNPDTNTKKEHIRRDVKVTVPKVVIGSGTLKT